MQTNQQVTTKTAVKLGALWVALLVLNAAMALVAIAVGSAGYSLGEIIQGISSAEANPIKTIVISLRLPRVLLALLVGAALSAAGALLQAVMRNPLADPGTIGVSAGASTAATSIMLLFPNMLSAVPLFAFAGAALASVLIYVMAWKGRVDPVRIILSGVAVNSVLGAYNGLLQLLNSDRLQGVLAFMNGSLSGRSWPHVHVAVVYTSIGLVLAFMCIKSANVLQLGDEMAQSLGMKVSLNRVLLSGVSAFLAAATVSVAGMIGFVGLVVPHISRLMVGSDHKALLPTCVLLGALILLAADTLGRVIVPGMEIPVGIVMAVTGGPFFLYMLRKRGKAIAS